MEIVLFMLWIVDTSYKFTHFSNVILSFLLKIWHTKYFLVILHRIFNKINDFPVGNVQKVYVILVVLMFVCIGCQWQWKPAETDASGRRIGIQRFDRIEMLYLTTGDYSALQQMNTYFPTETRMLIEDMLHLGQVDDPDINTKFLFFFQDSTLRQMLNDVQQQFNNMDDVDEQLSLAFKRLKEAIPDIAVPVVYTQIGSFDQSIIVSGGSLGVSLDKYLGVDYPFYAEHYSEQERKLMHRDMIVPDCMSFYLLSIYPMPKGHTQADRDRHMGRIMWTVNRMMQKQVFDNDYVDAASTYMHHHPRTSIHELLQER